MKNKRKILFAIVAIMILAIGAIVLLKLKQENIIFGKSSVMLSEQAKKLAVGDELNTIIIGDVNVDGKVTTKDAEVLKQYLAGELDESKINKIASDTNKDSKINDLDYAEILRYLNEQGNYGFVGTKVVEGNKLLILGDANGDEKVDLEDATLIQKYLAGVISKNQINLATADVNNDSVVNYQDIKEIREYARVNEDGYLGSVVVNDTAHGIMWLFDKVKKDGNYYAENVMYVSGYVSGDLVVPESFLSNYTYKTVSMTDVAFNECASKVERIVIPNGIANINEDLFEGCSGLKSVIFLQNEGTLALKDSMFSDADENLIVYYYHGVTISDSYTGLKQESPYIYSITCNQNYVEDTGNLITVIVKFTAKTKGEYIPYLKMKVGDTKLQLYSKEINDNRDEITYKYYKNPGLSGEILIEGFEYSSLKDDETGYFYIDMDTSEIKLNQSIDTESVLINKVTIQSNNSISSDRAKVGDTITLTFNSTEEIYNYGDFIVEIGGITNKDSRGLLNMQHPELTTYTASLLITEEIVNDLLTDYDGNILIRIKDYRDSSNNKGDTINSTTPDENGNCSYVRIDTVNPSITKMEAKGFEQDEEGDYVEKRVLKAGDVVEVIIHSSEILHDNKNYPLLGIKFGEGEEILVQSERMATGGGPIYNSYFYYYYTVKEGDNGKLSFTSLNGEMVDLAGNVNTLQVTDFSNKEIYKTNDVEADTILPYVQGVNITLDEEIDYFITKTDEENNKKIYGKNLNIIIDVQFTEIVNNEENKIPYLNTSIIKKVEGQDITEEKDKYTTIRYEINTRDIRNLPTVEFILQQLQNIELTDIAGNITKLELPEDYTVNNEAQTIYIDTTAPDINFKDESRVNTVDGVIYTKYCDLLNDSSITDNYLDAEDITITLKDEYEQEISNYTGVQVSNLQSLKLQDGEYYMDLEDALGNTRTVHFVIDNKKPQLNVIYNTAEDGHIEHVTLEPNVDENISVNKVKLYEMYSSNINSYGNLLDYNYLTDNIPVAKDEEGNIVSKTYKVVATDYAGNSSTKYFTVNPEDTQVDNLTVSYTKNEDGTTTATISSTEYLQEIEGWEISTDRKSISKTYTENILETVAVEDLCANTKDVIIKIDNADNEVENVKVTYRKEEGKTVATISSTEELREVAEWTLSYDGKKLVKEYTQETVETVTVEDLCGNTKDITVKIDNDDVEVEGVTVTYTEVEEGKVKATISSTEELREVEGWTLSEDKKSMSREYVTNTMETVTVEDLCGNTKDVYVKVITIEQPVLNFERKTQYQYVSDEDEMVIMVHSDKLMKLDEFKINGKDVTINNGTEYRNDYEVRIKVTEDMPEGDVTLEYTCTYDDQNEGTKRGSIVTDIYTIDREEPVLEKFEVIGYSSNKTKEKTELKAGDVVEVSLEFNEQVKLTEMPQLKIKFGIGEEQEILEIKFDNGEEIVRITSEEELQEFFNGNITFGKDNNYFEKVIYTYTVKAEDEGRLKISSLTMQIEDIARNEKNIVKSNNTTGIIADNTAPYIENITTKVINTGDANGDGKVNYEDAELIQSYISGYREENIDLEASDVNDDGYITVEDATTIQEYVLGLTKLSEVYTKGNDTYIGTKKKIKISVNLSEDVIGNSIPTLTIKIGDGQNIKLDNGVLDGDKITYSYMTSSDNGKLNIISLNSGNVTDKAGNALNKTIPETDTKIYVDTQLANIKVNLAAGEIEEISKNGLVYLKDFVTSIEIEDLSGVKDYTLKYFDEVIKVYELTQVIAKDGDWTLEVKDNVGNTARYNFVIDTTAPTVKLNGEDTNNVESIDNILIEVTDENLNKITLKKDGREIEFHYETQTTIYEAGEYIIKATDKAGNSTEKQFTVKRKAPTINMYLGDTQDEYTPNTWTNQHVRVELNVEPTDDVLQIEYRTSGDSTWRTVSDNKVVISKTGEYDFEARTKYTNDKYSTTTEKIKIKVDRIKPTMYNAQIDPGENTQLINEYYNGEVTVTIPVGTDENSGVSRLVYIINGKQATSTKEVKTKLQESKVYDITYYNVDNAGNQSQEKKLTIKIDKEAPVITYLNSEDKQIQGKVNQETEYILTKDGQVEEINEFTYFNQYVKLGIKDDVSGIDNSSLQLFKYNEEVKKYVEFTDTSIMRDGRYIVTVKDNIGYRTTKGFVVDATAPVVAINNSVVEGENVYYNSDVEIDVLAPDTDAIVKAYSKGENGGYSKEYKFLNQIHKITEEGSYKVDVTDYVGNVTTIYVTIDKTIPVVNEILGPTNWTNQNVILTVNASDSISGIAEYSWDNGITWTTTNTREIVQNGTYTVIVKDRAGNISRAESIELNKIDKILPTLSVTGNLENWTNQNVTLSIIAQDENSGVANVKVNGQNVTTNNGRGSYAVETNGTYTVVVTDNAGNSKEENVTVSKIDKVAPVITAIVKNTENIADKVILTVNGTDEGSGIAGYSWNNGQTWTTSNIYEVTANGTYAVTIKDNAGNISEKTIVVNNIKNSEEPYFIINNYATKLQQNKNYVVGISTSTNMGEFKQYIQTNLEYTIVDKYGNTVGNDQIVATDMKIKVSDGREYILVVRGDLNSNGRADISDLGVMASYLVGKGNLTTTYLLAGDLNNDNEVDITDISILASAITKKIRL